PDPALASGPLVGVSSPTPSTMPPPLPVPLPPDDAAAEPPPPPEAPPVLPPELAAEQLPALTAQSAMPIWLLALVNIPRRWDCIPKRIPTRPTRITATRRTCSANAAPRRLPAKDREVGHKPMRT